MELGLSSQLTRRSKNVLNPDEKKGRSLKPTCPVESPIKNFSWSKMLAKVCQVDVTQCPHCKGEMAIIAAMIDRS